ncbi:MAG TPA: Holliday junction resolvase RuvX [Pyrinomonadaceae bacterium]|jgi:putative Holliday junction resolvase
MRASSVLFRFAPRKLLILVDLTEPLRESQRQPKPPGRLLAVDLGAKRVGVAVCDELRLTVRPLMTIERRSWKNLLKQVAEQIERLGVAGLVIGLPVNMDGSEGAASAEVRRLAENFRRSLSVPVYLQDERLTTEEAKSRISNSTRQSDVDAEAAAVILQDFLSQAR